MRSLILPGDPGFEETLLTFSPEFTHERDRLNGEVWQVVDPETGMLRIANEKETIEYLYGGEYDIRQRQIGMLLDDESSDFDDDWEEEEIDDLLY